MTNELIRRAYERCVENGDNKRAQKVATYLTKTLKEVELGKASLEVLLRRGNTNEIYIETSTEEKGILGKRKYYTTVKVTVK